MTRTTAAPIASSAPVSPTLPGTMAFILSAVRQVLHDLAASIVPSQQSIADAANVASVQPSSHRGSKEVTGADVVGGRQHRGIWLIGNGVGRSQVGAHTGVELVHRPRQHRAAFVYRVSVAHLHALRLSEADGGDADSVAIGDGSHPSPCADGADDKGEDSAALLQAGAADAQRLGRGADALPSDTAGWTMRRATKAAVEHRPDRTMKVRGGRPSVSSNADSMTSTAICAKVRTMNRTGQACVSIRR